VNWYSELRRYESSSLSLGFNMKDGEWKWLVDGRYSDQITLRWLGAVIRRKKGRSEGVKFIVASQDRTHWWEKRNHFKYVDGSETWTHTLEDHAGGAETMKLAVKEGLCENGRGREPSWIGRRWIGERFNSKASTRERKTLQLKSAL